MKQHTVICGTVALLWLTAFASQHDRDLEIISAMSQSDYDRIVNELRQEQAVEQPSDHDIVLRYYGEK